MEAITSNWTPILAVFCGLACCGVVLILGAVAVVLRLGVFSGLGTLLGGSNEALTSVEGMLDDEEPGAAFMPSAVTHRRPYRPRRRISRATLGERSLEDIRDDYERRFKRRFRDDPEDALDEMDSFFDDTELD